MALVTVQRSPTPSATSSPCASEVDSGEDDCRFQPRSISESFLTVKGAALFLPRGNSSSSPRISHRQNKHAGDLQQHLQAMFMLLRPEDNIRLAVKLESSYQNRTRYMVVVSTNGRQDTEESIVLGMDFSCNDSICTMGLVLPLWSDALIHLDGDGGFSVSTDNRVHIFKPVSVQAMWSALQSLHKACEVARVNNYYPGSLFLTWVSYYESRLNSDQSSVNEWNAMQDVQSHRPDSPALFTDVPTERERTERLIKTKLREIMMQKDLENITSKEIRTELEMQMACNLREFKEFIDNEMIVILGQMDSPTQIFDHVFLGSEWNASNLEDLQNRGVRYILNVTREIDNFFPGVFEYHNIRVYDEEATDLLAYWNDTYKFISKAKKNGSKCLVHCKMGVSRSASTVIAYAMKEYGWNLDRAYDYVKERRTVTKPNPSFMRQLEEYQGILLASKQRHNKLWRSHSDSDLSDHHEPMGKSGMEVSKKEITTSADRISENKTSSGGHHPPMTPGGVPASPHTEHAGHLGSHAVGSLLDKERLIQPEVTLRDLEAERMEDKLNLNNINGCPSGCCFKGSGFALDNCGASEALQPQGEAGEEEAVAFPDLTVDDLEKDALKHGDGSIQLLPLEALQPCLGDAPSHTFPSPPPVPSQPKEVDFGADRIDFFSALEKFVELSQDSRPRTCSHSRVEDQGGGRNSHTKALALELLSSNPAEDPTQGNSTGNSPQASEESSADEDQPKLLELDCPSGLTRSHSENAISVKDIVTEIELIRQGGGQLKVDALNNPIPTPKRSAVYELPAESPCEHKPGRAEPEDGGTVVLKEAAREPLKLDRDASPCNAPAEEGVETAEDPAEGPPNPGPKWCPGSVRRATLEFEERLRQEQELQQSPAALLPARKNSRNEPTAAEPFAKSKNEEPPLEPAQTSRGKEAPRAGLDRPAALSRSPSPDGVPVEWAGVAKEHRMVISLESREEPGAPCPLPRRIEVIEYTPATQLPCLSGAERSCGRGALEEETKVAVSALAIDENCNATLLPDDSTGAFPSLRPSEGQRQGFRKAFFSLGSPEEEEGEEEEEAPERLPSAASSPPADQPGCPPRSPPHLVRLEGVTQGSTSTDPDPVLLGGYAGNGQFAFEERGAVLRRGSEGALMPWGRENLGPPVPASARPPWPSLPHSSSSDSIRDLNGAAGLVKRRAQELEARMRHAGLTAPSQMKRSASLAKLGCLDLSKDDLSNSDGVSPPPLEPPRAPSGQRQSGSRGSAVPRPRGPAGPSPQPTLHLVEPLKMTERVALSRPVELPEAQYAKEFGLSRQLPGAQLTNAQPTAAATGTPLSAPAPWLAVLPQYQPGRTRLPRRLKKAGDRKRTTNPLYNTM